MPSRVDANQREIVAGLRKVGALVLHLHMIGKGVPDLLVYFRGVFYLMEVKIPGAKLNDLEQEFHRLWPVYVVHDLAEACAVLAPPPLRGNTRPPAARSPHRGRRAARD